MTLPTTIRTNVMVPFPARVQGSGPIVVTKANGIWTVSFDISKLATQVPAVGNYPTDFIPFFDSIAKTSFSMSIASLAAAISGAARPQRFTNATPIIVGPTDQIIICGINANATCALPAAAGRGGVPLTFKGIGFETAHPIVFTPNGVETIDGAANYTMNVNRQEVTFVPFNDGTHTGWYIG